MNQDLVALRDAALEKRRVVDAEITALASVGLGRGETAVGLRAKRRELFEKIAQYNTAISRAKYASQARSE